MLVHTEPIKVESQSNGLCSHKEDKFSKQRPTYVNRCIQNTFSFGDRNLLDYYTRGVGLSNSMARPVKLR